MRGKKKCTTPDFFSCVHIDFSQVVEIPASRSRRQIRVCRRSRHGDVQMGKVARLYFQTKGCPAAHARGRRCFVRDVLNPVCCFAAASVYVVATLCQRQACSQFCKKTSLFSSLVEVHHVKRIQLKAAVHSIGYYTSKLVSAREVQQSIRTRTSIATQP